MRSSLSSSAPFALGLLPLQVVSGSASAAVAGPPVHIGLTPGSAVVFVGQDQVYTATLYDSTYNEAAIETGGQIGFAIDMPSFADVAIDASDPHLAHVTGAAVGMTNVRVFYVRDGAQTDIVSTAALTVVPALGTGGATGTGGAVSTGGATATGGMGSPGGTAGPGGATGVGGGPAAGGATGVGGGPAAGGATGVGGGTGVGGDAGLGGGPGAGGVGGASVSCANTMCGGTCANLSADVRNCGSCGVVCEGEKELCMDGLCARSPENRGPGCSLSGAGSNHLPASTLALSVLGAIVMALRRRKR